MVRVCIGMLMVSGKEEETLSPISTYVCRLNVRVNLSSLANLRWYYNNGQIS
jgi:hypothetical protein